MGKRKMQLALVLLKERREHFARWEAECAEERKRGYRPSACVHGTNQWTDYDNICGACEDGLGYWDYQVQARDCLNEAEGVEHKVRQRIKVAGDMATLDHAHRVGKHDAMPWQEIADWVNLPYTVRGIE